MTDEGAAGESLQEISATASRLAEIEEYGIEIPLTQKGIDTLRHLGGKI